MNESASEEGEIREEIPASELNNTSEHWENRLQRVSSMQSGRGSLAELTRLRTQATPLETTEEVSR